MKVLKKNEALDLRNKATQQQIDEGVRLAKRIDALRINLASIEKQHTTFVQSMKDSLTKEIVPLEIKRDNLREDIKRAQAELERLKIPLTKEWDDARVEKERLEKWARQLDLKQQELVEDETSIEEDRKKIDAEKAIVENLKVQVSSNIAASTNLREQAEKALNASQVVVDKRNSELADIELKVAMQEKTSDLREVDLDNRQKNLEGKEIELDIRERQINDRYQTLERTIKRLKK